jgi:1-deoxy-D-xylulose-5-phosphate synthase
MAVLSIGHPGNFVVQASKHLTTEGIDVAHYDMRFVKPLDEALLHEIGSRFSKIITVEDGTVQGGFGSAVLEFFNAHGYKPDISILGIPDRVIEHGKPSEQYKECGFDAEAIIAKASSLMSAKSETHMAAKP